MALMGPARPAVFLDKDGTLIQNVPYNVDPALLDFTPGACAALSLLAEYGFALVVVTNQPGLALGRFDRQAWVALRHALLERVKSEAGVALDDIMVCPHAPSPTKAPLCLCRKPASGLLRQAAARHRLDLSRSWMVGDILDDVEAGRRAGCRSLLLDVGNETEWRMSPLRTPEYLPKDLLDAADWIMSHSTVPVSRTMNASVSCATLS